MAEYIERAELLKKQYNASNFCSPELAEMAVDVRDIEDAPAADVAPVRHGKWEYCTDAKMLKECYMCSACGNPRYERYAFADFNYCPRCGAKMRNDKEEAEE